MIIPDVTTGVIPNSINVPLFDARIARIQYKGSDESEDMMPYSGTWEQTRKIKRVVAVHSTLWLNGTCGIVSTRRVGCESVLTFLSGAATSGRMLWNGRTSSRNLTEDGTHQRVVSCTWRRTHSRPFLKK
jgi:hypothetical protein